MTQLSLIELIDAAEQTVSDCILAALATGCKKESLRTLRRRLLFEFGRPMPEVDIAAELAALEAQGLIESHESTNVGRLVQYRLAGVEQAAFEADELRAWRVRLVCALRARAA